MNKSLQAVAVFDKCAQLYQQKYGQQELYDDGFQLFCNTVAPGPAHVLELACGPGNVSSYLLRHRPDFQLLGTDLAPNMIALARLANPTAQFELLDCRQINQLTQWYDGIVCAFGLPYLDKEAAIQFIADASQKLQANGVLYLSTMEGDYSSSHLQTGSTGDSIFIHYHEAGYLKSALAQFGFELVSEQRKTYPAADGSTTVDLILIAQWQGSTK